MNECQQCGNSEEVEPYGFHAYDRATYQTLPPIQSAGRTISQSMVTYHNLVNLSAVVCAKCVAKKKKKLYALVAGISLLAVASVIGGIYFARQWIGMRGGLGGVLNVAGPILWGAWVYGLFCLAGSVEPGTAGNILAGDVNRAELKKQGFRKIRRGHIHTNSHDTKCNCDKVSELTKT